MMLPFATAAGSTPGREHLISGKPNQDAWRFHASNGALVAVVCDGCGSAEHSSVGAQLGAQLLTAAIVHILQRAGSLECASVSLVADVLEQARESVLVHLRSLVDAMDGPPDHIIHDYFLFSVVGLLVTADQTAIFSLGDGLYALNGEITNIGPFPENAPPYLSYGLVASSEGEERPNPLRFHIHHLIPTAAVDSIMIATDGAADFVAVAHEPIPGSDEHVGPVSQFWTDQRYIDGPDALRRRLARLNRRATAGVAMLPDDTTVLVVARRKEAE